MSTETSSEILTEEESSEELSSDISRDITMPQNTTSQADRNAFINKTTPFVLGEEPWCVYLDYFMSRASAFSVDDKIKKICLYNSLKGQARLLACPEFNPETNAKWTDKSIEEYSKALGEMFEPSAEKENIKLEYEVRTQRLNEHPALYFRDKYNLFIRAYVEEARDYESFYHRIISGLTNQIMKDFLRDKIPENVQDVSSFRANILKAANIVRRKFIDGEITEAESLGAECYKVYNSYSTELTPSSFVGKIKQESVNSMYNKVPQKKMCYHCKNEGHFIAQCPRKAAGLAPTVQALHDDAHDKVVAHTRGMKPLYSQRKYSVSGTTQNQPTVKSVSMTATAGSDYNQKKRYNQRVAHVFEDAQGNVYVEDIGSESDETEEDQVVGAINTLDLNPDGFSEIDYVPGAFLGM